MGRLPAAQSTQQIGHYELAPPYTEFKMLNATDPAGSVLLPGVLLALRPHYGASEAMLMHAVDAIRRRSPSTTVVLWLDLMGREAAVRMFAAVNGRGVRGVVLNGTPEPARLRADLTNPDTLSGDALWWLERRGVTVRRGLRQMIAATVQYAVDCQTLTALQARAESDGEWRSAAHHSGLGPMRAVHQTFRLLALGVAVQREEHRSIESIAHDAGYVDASALRRRFNEVLGYTPGVIKRRLGWEWILDGALRRKLGSSLPLSEASASASTRQ